MRCMWKNKSRLTPLALVLALGVSMSGCAEKYELDRQMEELCKKDGGVKIYETVKLPPEMFDKSGYPFPGWESRLDKADRLSNDYLYIDGKTIIKGGDVSKGEGELTRYDLRIIRKSDSKLLAESISYARAGGDGWFFVHPSGKACTLPTDKLIESVNGVLEKLVFIKE